MFKKWKGTKSYINLLPFLKDDLQRHIIFAIEFNKRESSTDENGDELVDTGIVSPLKGELKPITDVPDQVLRER
ncbi:hypothetical protein A8F94_24015 [Bacillus sp. FJAT-27225]|nr:hypothetical protein A8F94_24015 [Bacillus sp. FJAT-27225]